MAIVLRVDELFRDAQLAGHARDYEYFDDPAVLGGLWCVTMLEAIRDHATSVHYHPWREDGGLAYVVDGVRQVLVTPPAVSAGAILAVARSMFTAPGRGGWLAHLCRRTNAGAACASVALDMHSHVFVWDAVVWSSGERSGVELFYVAQQIS